MTMKQTATWLLLAILCFHGSIGTTAEPPAEDVNAKAKAAAKQAKKVKAAAKKAKKSEQAFVVPEYDELDTGILTQASRAALVSAVEFFKKRAAEDDEGWIVPPRRTRKVVDHKTFTVNYREVKKEVPVYEYEYETYEVVAKKKSGQSVDAIVTFKKEKRRRVVSRKQVGTKMVVTHVRDDNGPITRTHSRPVYGQGGPDVWSLNALGDNALVLYALRKAGLSTDDELVRTLAEDISCFVASYGYPDATWDLAWVTAAFALMPEDYHKKIAGEMASKLLDGQINEGAARGLWGPVCINVPLMMEFIPKVTKLSVDLVAARKVAAGGETGFEEEQRAEKAHREASAAMKRIAVFAMAGPSVETRLSIAPGDAETVTVPGLAHYIYNQTSADIGSTALVLFALREVSARGLMPETVWRPEGLRTKADSPSAILARTAYTLASAQKPGGGWDEMNRHQPVKAPSAGILFPGLPPKAGAYPALDSAMNPLTAAQGFQALANAGHVVGFDKLMGRYGRNVQAGLASYRAAADTFIKDFKNSGPLGGHFSPYECAFFLKDAADVVAGVGDERPDLKARIAYALLTERQEDGSWGVTLNQSINTPLSTSLRARMKALVPKDPKAAMDYAAPHVSKGYQNLERMRLSGRRPRPVEDSVVPTALAMLALLDGIRPPVAGQCLWGKETQPSALVPLITMVMTKNHGPEFRHLMLARPITVEVLSSLPGLFIRGSGSFDPSADEKKALGEYMAKGGFVLVEMAADAKGLPFFKQAQTVLQGVLPGSTVGNIGADKELLGNMAGRGAVQALKNEGGSLSALFLPVATAGGRGGLAGHVAAEIAYNTLLQKIGPSILEENYPIAMDNDTSVEELIEQITAGPSPATEAPVPAEEEAPADADQNDAPVEPEAKKPAADEVW